MHTLWGREEPAKRGGLNQLRHCLHTCSRLRKRGLSSPRAPNPSRRYSNNARQHGATPRRAGGSDSHPHTTEPKSSKDWQTPANPSPTRDSAVWEPEITLSPSPQQPPRPRRTMLFRFHSFRRKTLVSGLSQNGLSQNGYGCGPSGLSCLRCCCILHCRYNICCLLIAS